MSNSFFFFFSLTIIRQRSASYMHGTYLNKQGQKVVYIYIYIFSLGISVLNPGIQVPKTMLL